MTSEEEKAQRAQRIVAARMRLRERFLKKMKQTPSAADERPQGSGPPNRHKLPVGQHQVTAWPVLDLGAQPTVARTQWRLQVDGAVEEPLSLTWETLEVRGYSNTAHPWRDDRYS